MRVVQAGTVRVFTFSVVRRRFLLDSPNLFEPLPDARLESLIGRLVVLTPEKARRQAGHVRHFLFRVVRVLIALAVSEVAHQPGGRIS